MQFLRKTAQLAAVLFPLMFLSMCGTTAFAVEPGTLVTSGVYCNSVDDEFMKQFTATVVNEGMDGYFRIMNDPNVPCWDARLHRGIHPVQFELIELKWTFPAPSGVTLDMWTAKDRANNVGYIWIDPSKAPKKPEA